MRATAAVLIALVVTGCSIGAGAVERDPLKVAPANYTVLLENDRVRVLDFRIAAGERESWHSHPAYVAYVLQPSELRFTFPDGRTLDRHASPGDVFWSEATTHRSENIGTTDAHAILVELQ